MGTAQFLVRRRAPGGFNNPDPTAKPASELAGGDPEETEYQPL
jgi:hypothetical protein